MARKHPTPVRDAVTEYLSNQPKKKAKLTDMAKALNKKRINLYFAVMVMKELGLVEVEKAKATPPFLTIKLKKSDNK